MTTNKAAAISQKIIKFYCRGFDVLTLADFTFD